MLSLGVLRVGMRQTRFVGIKRNNVADEGIEQQTEGRNGNVAEQRYPTRSRKAPARYGHDKEEQV